MKNPDDPEPLGVAGGSEPMKMEFPSVMNFLEARRQRLADELHGETSALEPQIRAAVLEPEALYESGKGPLRAASREYEEAQKFLSRLHREGLWKPKGK